jgi:hypothetical protein
VKKTEISCRPVVICHLDRPIKHIDRPPLASWLCYLYYIVFQDVVHTENMYVSVIFDLPVNQDDSSDSDIGTARKCELI